MRWQGLITAVVGLLFLTGGTASAEVRTVTFTCLDDRMEEIRLDPVQGTRDAFKACRGEIEEYVPFARSRLKQKVVLTHLIAYQSAPYGDSNAVTLPELFEVPVLNCGNYGVLAYWLHRGAWGRKQARGYVQIGWEGGPVLNHAQTLFHGMLLDPTAGVVAPANLQQLLAGDPVSPVVNFHHRTELPRYQEDLAAWRVAVQTALEEGQFAPDQLIYRWTIDSQYNGFAD